VEIVRAPDGRARGLAARAQKGNAMIRQAILCDICGAEKKQANNWLVAYIQEGELRVSGWSPQKLLHPGAKHLCGQICLHKLVDEFVAQALAKRLPAVARPPVELREKKVRADTDASLTSDAAYDEFESSARLIPTPAPLPPVPPQQQAPVEVVAAPAIKREEEAAAPLNEPASLNEPAYFASRDHRAAAWERERAREHKSCAAERHPGLAAIRHRFSS
jgi:hypothetical protein